MRTALLLTGNPRFSIDFDSQINNLKNSRLRKGFRSLKFIFMQFRYQNVMKVKTQNDR